MQLGFAHPNIYKSVMMGKYRMRLQLAGMICILVMSLISCGKESSDIEETLLDVPKDGFVTNCLDYSDERGRICCTNWLRPECFYRGRGLDTVPGRQSDGI